MSECPLASGLQEAKDPPQEPSPLPWREAFSLCLAEEAKEYQRGWINSKGGGQ